MKYNVKRLYLVGTFTGDLFSNTTIVLLFQSSPTSTIVIDLDRGGSRPDYTVFLERLLCKFLLQINTYFWFVLMLYLPVNNFSVMMEQFPVFLG